MTIGVKARECKQVCYEYRPRREMAKKKGNRNFAIPLDYLVAGASFRAFSTNQLSAGYSIFGDFSQVIIASGRVGVDRRSLFGSKSGIISVTVFQSVDIALRHGAAFTVSTSTT